MAKSYKLNYMQKTSLKEVITIFNSPTLTVFLYYYYKYFRIAINILNIQSKREF